ncbi:amidohydrolase [Cellulomonas citrea]|uniref:amidohydrolase n=1 Tax=Cellulomonas citrea TaxID=1909423 RepID=UPI00191639FF|nr:amidohydrolase [Cellulomonas citrea]
MPATVAPVVIHLGSFVTMEPSFPTAEAVAVRDGRIVAVGSLAQVRSALGDEPFELDETLSGLTVLPGFIDQHLHPILGASTLATEVVSIEEWVLPGRTFAAATSAQEYRSRIADAVAAMPPLSSAPGTVPPDAEWFFSWGYQALWHGPLDRAALDAISTTRPVVVWQRSCHEWYLNTAAIEALGIDEASVQGHGDASTMVDLAAGHWWETGMNLLLPVLMPHFLTPARLVRGLQQMVAYLHLNGVTAYNEPGALFTPDMWTLYQGILGAPDTPFTSYFLVDGRAQVDAGLPLADTLADAEKQVALAPPGSGKLEFFDKQIKLFADGAIISQLMQMKDPYLDAAGRPDPAHHGAWLITPEHLEERTKLYWDAGWQIHCHVNGDEGLDVLLDILERRMRENPRADHRSVIVHFANSTPEQVDRIARLGAIVSANPYYTTQFADAYGQVGLGPVRADAMVRSADVLAAKVPLSFHSDLPMGPSSPLNFVWCAVNRLTVSGRVAAPEQRIGVHDALRAITIEAAYSWRKEHEIGSIAPGKQATFTALGEDPYTVAPEHLRDIPVVGTMYQGRWFPV